MGADGKSNYQIFHLAIAAALGYFLALLLAEHGLAGTGLSPASGRRQGSNAWVLRVPVASNSTAEHTYSEPQLAWSPQTLAALAAAASWPTNLPQHPGRSLVYLLLAQKMTRPRPRGVTARSAGSTR